MAGSGIERPVSDVSVEGRVGRGGVECEEEEEDEEEEDGRRTTDDGGRRTEEEEDRGHGDVERISECWDMFRLEEGMRQQCRHQWRGLPAAATGLLAGSHFNGSASSRKRRRRPEDRVNRRGVLDRE